MGIIVVPTHGKLVRLSHGFWGSGLQDLRLNGSGGINLLRVFHLHATLANPMISLQLLPRGNRSGALGAMYLRRREIFECE
jgi:hypothetical protein